MRLHTNISICFSGLLLLIGSVRVGAQPTPERQPLPAVPATQECLHRDVQGAVQQAHVHIAEGDALFAHVQKLLNEGRSLQDPVLQALGSKIHASYEQAAFHLSTAQVQALLSAMSAPAEAAMTERTQVPTLDALLRNLARSQRDAWKVTHGWPAVGTLDLAIQMRHVEDTLQSEWGVARDASNAGEEAKEEMGRLLGQGNRNAAVRAQATRMYDACARARETLWRIRIGTEVWMSSAIEGTVPSTVRDQYERVLAFIDRANSMQALALRVLLEGAQNQQRAHRCGSVKQKRSTQMNPNPRPRVADPSLLSWAAPGSLIGLPEK